MMRAKELLSQKRLGFRKETEKALEKLGTTHPASKHLRSILRSLDHRPPTKREKALVHAIVPQQMPDQWVNVAWNQKPTQKALSTSWKTLCIRCHEASSKVLSIILGFPVCDSCHAMFEQGFENLISTDLDVEFVAPRRPTRDVDPMGIANEEMDIDI